MSATFTVDHSGTSALDLAAQAEHRDVVKRMPQYADIHLKASTPLPLAHLMVAPFARIGHSDPLIACSAGYT
ncbi:hypothetical protein [Massilia sp. LjRoot122]|uniref:hypothetical protein n=1 Tax=Massilia sp. LjRoot122 TaxID=3342257 RepID=UPI003ECF4D16